MNNKPFFLALSTLIPLTSVSNVAAETPPGAPTTHSPLPVKAIVPAKPLVTPLTPFTGKVTKNKVRLRLQPSLDSPIVREFNRNDLVIVDGEREDFYLVQLPSDVKGYVFRTFILDGAVEGQNVNVRLEPSTEAPIIAQLKQSEKVEGNPSPVNSKWLEITPPTTVRFYISKDYIEKVGDSKYKQAYETRRKEVNSLLDSAFALSQQADGKPYQQMDYDLIAGQYQQIIEKYSEFEEQSRRAKMLLAQFQENFAKTKLEYLEKRSQEISAAEHLQKENSTLSQTLREQQVRVSQLQKQLEHSPAAGTGTNSALSAWLPNEEKALEEWHKNNYLGSVDEFYEDQKNNGVSLRGKVEPYFRNVKNKPGDYVLINAQGLPVAYLYSTHVNLQNLVGQDITITGTPRPNNNFAFPAYFVLEVTP